MTPILQMSTIEQAKDFAEHVGFSMINMLCTEMVRLGLQEETESDPYEESLSRVLLACLGEKFSAFEWDLSEIARITSVVLGLSHEEVFHRLVEMKNRRG